MNFGHASNTCRRNSNKTNQFILKLKRKSRCGGLIDWSCVWSEWWIFSGLSIETLLVEIFHVCDGLLEISHSKVVWPIDCIASIPRLIARFALLHRRKQVFECVIVESWTQAVITIWRRSERGNKFKWKKKNLRFNERVIDDAYAPCCRLSLTAIAHQPILIAVSLTRSQVICVRMNALRFHCSQFRIRICHDNIKKGTRRFTHCIASRMISLNIWGIEGGVAYNVFFRFVGVQSQFQLLESDESRNWSQTYKPYTMKTHSSSGHSIWPSEFLRWDWSCARDIHNSLNMHCSPCKWCSRHDFWSNLFVFIAE